MRSKLLALMLAALPAAAHAEAVVGNGWFRALPPSVPSGGYFELRNTGAKTITLTDISSPACGMLMMHQSRNGGMDHVMSLDVAAGQRIDFAPGGYHLMCMDAKLKPGTEVPVTLEFAGGARVTAPFQVRGATGK